MGIAQTVEALNAELVPARRGRLIEIAEDIHAHPEIRWEERHASALLADELEGEGFAVERGFAGLETAFVARWSTEGADADAPTIAFFCEYDALEGIGHACGHNIIAAAGLGGALLTRDALVSGGVHGLPTAAVHLLVVGSPAEEGAAGKVPMIEAGVLDGVDAAMMVHPSGYNETGFAAMGRVAMDVEFQGRASHAAATPHDGVNALDAATLSLTAIGLLRQQLKDGARVHAIVTNGGQAPNIIPESAGVRVFVRSLEKDYLLDTLVPKVRACFEGAAIATGCTVEITSPTPAYSTMRNNPVLAGLAGEAFAAVGREEPSAASFGASTDMGNVSHLVPAMHPMLELEHGIANHTREFTAAARGERADAATVDGALVLAATALELLARPELIGEARRAFDAGG